MTPEGNGDSPTSAATATAEAPPAASTAAPSESALRGGWTLHVTSEQPGINPDQFDTPEARAKVFFDHAATVGDGQLRIDHRTLGKHWTVAADAAKKLDDIILSVDWKKMQLRTSLEEGQVGGTIFQFEVTRGGETITLKTGNLDAHPDLLFIVKTLKETAGVP